MTCLFCDKPTLEGHNYCDWTCHVEDAKKAGGKVICPNGLPIRCIMADGTMLECEHGDHPDYKFPVEVEYTAIKPELPEWDDSYGNQTHALIYSDGKIAVTMYECCYAMWGAEGLIKAGNMWKDGEWRLTDESIEKIVARNR